MIEWTPEERAAIDRLTAMSRPIPENLHFDRDGDTLTLWEWSVLRKRETYGRVAVTRFTDGYELSTVWLGFDHGFGMGAPPIIFESMLFAPEPHESYGHKFDRTSREDDEHGFARYATEQEALHGHRTMVEALTQKHGEPVPLAV